MTTIEIDSCKIEAENGKNLLEVCISNNIDVPHLCYDKRLKSFGCCRLCLVEISKIGLASACTTNIFPSMVVKTNTPKLRKIRRGLLELILSNHPDDCLTCEKNGNCKLQDYAYQYDVRREKYKEKLIVEKENRPYLTNPFIKRDVDKCILCGRCVRICDEIMGRNVLDFSFRGFSTEITTGLNLALEEANCEFCGQCISTCPTGALSSKIKKRARFWETKKTETICPYCGCGCRMILETKDNEIVNVLPYNDGFLCIKGRFGFDFVNHKERLRRPLIKENNRFIETDWETALNFVAKRFFEIIEKYGSDAIGGISSAKTTNEENFLFSKFMRAVLKTNNVDHCARLCHAPSVVALSQSFGSGAMTNPIGDIANSSCIIVIGSNTTEAHPLAGIKIKEAVIKNKASLIVIDPRKIELTEIADVFLRQKPGTDVALINGIMNVILQEGLHNKDFIKERTEGFSELCETIKAYDLEYVEKITTCKKEDIIKAARLYGNAKRGAIIYSMGITQHTTGVDNVFSLANLAMLTGNIGREGASLNPLRGQNNVQGCCDMGGLPVFFSGYQRVDDENVRKKFEERWKTSLPKNPGLTFTEMIFSPSIKCLFIMGENPLLSHPDINRVREEFKKKEFIVTSDIFLTETGELSDVVFPACSFAEKNGTFTNTSRQVQLINKAISAPGDALADWEIIKRLSNKMGFIMDYKNEEEIMDEIASLTPIYGGINYKRLKERPLHWPCPDISHPGTPILHREGFTRGKGKFIPVSYKPPKEEPEPEYPFILTTGRERTHYHTRTMTGRCFGLDRYIKSGYVEINPIDAERLKIQDNEMVKVKSRRGEITIRAKITEKVSPGVLFIPFHFKDGPANILTSLFLDPSAKTPELKVSCVSIEKLP